MDHPEFFLRRLDAHLDAKIVLEINVPRAGMANNIAISRLGEQRTFPESCRKRRRSQSRKRNSRRISPFRERPSCALQYFRQVVALRGLRRIHQVIYVVPFLRPDVAKQMCGNRAGRRHDIFSIFLGQLAANIGVERHIEWLQLLPGAVQFLLKGVRAACRNWSATAPPHRNSQVRESPDCPIQPCARSAGASAPQPRASQSTHASILPDRGWWLTISQWQ